MNAKPRLHWFWAGVLATIAGMAVYVMMAETVPGSVLDIPYRLIRDTLRNAGFHTVRGANIGTGLTLVLPSLVAAITIYAILMRRFSPVGDGELHCRRCHHILRGLSEPCCSECGEAI